MRSKKFLTVLIIVSCAVIVSFPLFGQVKYPKPANFVNDYAGVIPPEVEQKLNALLSLLERQTTAEVAVVTVPSLEGDTIEGYAVKLFAAWGIGKKGKDNGVLLLVAMQDRKMRIEVGYGLEGALPDGLCGEIRDKSIIPYFKQGQYAEGILAGTINIAYIVGKEYNVDILKEAGVAKNAYPIQEKQPFILRFLANLFYLLLFLLIFGGRFWLFPLFFGFTRRRGYWSGGGYYGGGGGFSGGSFGGFGGGFSGGGGASGGW